VFRFGSVVLVLAFGLFWVPSSARADWLFSGYMGAALTSPNTLTVTPAGGPPTMLRVSDYEGEAFRSPWYYGVRGGWLPASTRGFGFEVEWNHAKAIAQLTHDAQDLNQFQQSHGLNFLRGGAGISTPHVESTFRNVHQEQYQYGGIAWQAGAGIEYHLWQFVHAIADARITRVSEKHLRGAGVEIAGPFFSRHVDFGVALRLPE
jgi:lipid A oxidase